MDNVLPCEFSGVNLTDLQRFAASLVRCLPGHAVIGLVGTLGAGKTTLVQAIARALQIDAAEVTSPTFTLLQSHRGILTLHHLDAYRVADEDEFLELGVEELFDDEASWTVVEWADRFPRAMPDETLWLELRIDPQPDRRSLKLTTRNTGLRPALDRLADEFAKSR
jgi:tRNA threonylcarbamoyladenosine biosynthesis protein TsaE